MSVIADKQIYKHGALRKVQYTYIAVPSVYLHAWFIWLFMCYSDTQVCSKKVITIGAVTVHIAGNTSQLRDHPSIHLWRTFILSTHLCPGKPSIVRGKLVHNGDYIKFEDLIGTVSTLQHRESSTRRPHRLSMNTLLYFQNTARRRVRQPNVDDSRHGYVRHMHGHIREEHVTLMRPSFTRVIPVSSLSAIALDLLCLEPQFHSPHHSGSGDYNGRAYGGGNRSLPIIKDK